MRRLAALAVCAAGVAAALAVAGAAGLPPTEGLQLIGISVGAALAVGLAATGLLRLLPHTRFGVQMTIVVVAGIAAVAAGALAAAWAMVLPAEDLAGLVVVVLSAGTAGALVALTVSQRVNRAQASLTEATRRLREGAGSSAADPPPIKEFATLAAELETTRQRLQESRQRERLLDASRRELITWLSHDLRTPLAGIRALAQALGDGVATDPATVARYHHQLDEQAARVAEMVEDLFALSRIHSGAAEHHLPPVALRDLLSDAVAAAEALATARDVRITGRFEDPVAVRAAPAEVGRVLDNLLSNAVRETPRGGRVAVAAHVRDRGAVITVTDECGGIPDDVLARMFEAGYRAAEARTPDHGVRGGFGLTVARGLAEAHGGSLEVRNVPGGCEFRLTLMLACETRASAGDAREAPSCSPPRPGGLSVPSSARDNPGL
jgi:signal transduction histidine kinase